MTMHRIALLAFLALTACDKDPDKRTTAAESQVSAHAVADVDAATNKSLSSPSAAGDASASTGEATRAP
ncbi:hypothetical protein GCM10011529_01890 [Polymorphobacter glacialis]|uniref:Lipoprotein n=1 Tax=Sandarakinorhabdus glacialis TaxID=1614636 RepID=A0A916ZJ60_9SPHN|nr:hypothetical protein [Polymorphobacter glacialis]GGD99382.1 hypothetical protein GCM10011529_01890 [Polymorphobacter glacialis]